jgi:nucleoid DNA-binding protein
VIYFTKDENLVLERLKQNHFEKMTKFVRMVLIIRGDFMNKSELSEAIALGADISHEKGYQVLESLLAIIEKQLVGNQSVQLAGFGSFTAKERSARVGRNPKTGETIQIPASKTIRFTPGKAFKDYINQSIG